MSTSNNTILDAINIDVGFSIYKCTLITEKVVYKSEHNKNNCVKYIKYKKPIFCYKNVKRMRRKYGVII